MMGATPRALDGDYAPIERIGRGAQAEVWRATQVSTGRDVAVKRLAPGAGANARERLRREAAALARLDHPGIAGAYAHGTLEGRPALVLELVEGVDLAEALRRAPSGTAGAPMNARSASG